MLPLSENLLFVCKPADLVMSWHAACFRKWGEKNFSKKHFVVSQKTLISERRGIMGQVIFLERVQEVFEENRKFHNYNIINN